MTAAGILVAFATCAYHTYLARHIQLYAPDYILAHDPLWPHEQSVRALVEAGVYVPVPGVPFRGHVLLSRRSA